MYEVKAITVWVANLPLIGFHLKSQNLIDPGYDKFGPCYVIFNHFVIFIGNNSEDISSHLILFSPGIYVY